MHHSHVYEEFLLMYILFARRTHEHEGTFPIFTSFALMHIAKIHVTHWLLCYDYELTCSYVPYLHDCIHIGGDLCMLHVLPKLYLLFSISLSKALMYVVINYQKGGD